MPSCWSMVRATASSAVIACHTRTRRVRPDSPFSSDASVPLPVGVDAPGRQGGRRRLQVAAHLQHLQGVVVAQQLDREADPLQQQVRREAGHVGAVAAAHVQHARGHQRPHRLPRGVAGQAELGGQLVLGWQPRPGHPCQVPRTPPPRSAQTSDVLLPRRAAAVNGAILSRHACTGSRPPSTGRATCWWGARSPAPTWSRSWSRSTSSARFLTVVAWSGVALSAAALAGLVEAGPLWLWLLVWLLLWALYLSIVNVGQVFYAFGWESLLLEAGFLAIFLGPARTAPPLPVVWLLRWLLFRVELGAGLIKLRADPCWRELTRLRYHYETQPMPNPLSWFFHHLPEPLHRVEVLGNFFAQLVVPFFLFAPQPVASVAGAVIVLTQAWLVLSGNFSWLNFLTMTL